MEVPLRRGRTSKFAALDAALPTLLTRCVGLYVLASVPSHRSDPVYEEIAIALAMTAQPRNQPMRAFVTPTAPGRPRALASSATASQPL